MYDVWYISIAKSRSNKLVPFLAPPPHNAHHTIVQATAPEGQFLQTNA